MVRHLTTALLVGALCCGCGASGNVATSGRPTTAPAHLSTAGLATCLHAAGATVTTQPGEAEQGLPWQEEGEVEAHFGHVDVFLGVMTTERGARYHLAAGVSLAGGGLTIDGDPIEDHLGRVKNVSVLFSDVPDAGTRRAVEGCLGEALRFDPAKL